MLVRFFRSSFPTQYIATGIAGLAVWATALPQPPPMPVPVGPVPLYRFFYGLLSGSPYAATLSGFLVVLLSAYWLNRIMSANELVPKNSSLVSLVFIFMMSYAPSQLTLTPVNISVLLMLNLLQSLMVAYHRTDPVDLDYAAGFFISLAALFYLPVLVLYGFLLTSFIVYRTPNWREWVSSLIGLITPFLFLAGWFFWFDTLVPELRQFADFFRNISLHNPWNSAVMILPGCMILVLGAIGLYHQVVRGSERTVELRKKTVLMNWLVFWSLLAAIFAGDLLAYHPAFLFLSLAPALSGFLLGLRRPFRWELLLWAFLILVLANSILDKIL